MKRDKDATPVKRNPLRITAIVLVCLLVLGGALYQGYRVARDYMLEKVFVMFIEDEEQQGDEGSTDEQIDIQEAARAFERLNGAETEKDSDEKTEASDTKQAKKKNSQQEAKDLVGQIPEADKNRAIAIVSSVASVDDCFALYELAMKGDKNAKAQLKAIYNRFTQAQKDELWALYEKNKHLL